MKIVLNLLTVGAILALAAGSSLLAARGESLAALGTPFDGRCIPSPPQRGCRVGDPGAGCVAPRSNTPGILGRRALPTGRLARLGATPDFHDGRFSLATDWVRELRWNLCYARRLRGARSPFLAITKGSARSCVSSRRPSQTWRPGRPLRARRRQTVRHQRHPPPVCTAYWTHRRTNRH